MQIRTKVVNFTDLKVWQIGHRVVLSIYQVTKLFPRDEQFGLISQLRRAVVSITSNIAEGFSRSTARDKIYFYTIALGSLTEVQNQLLIAKDLGYLNNNAFFEMSKQLTDVQKMIHGLIKSAVSRP
jgi:four helix bundle protein